MWAWIYICQRQFKCQLQFEPEPEFLLSCVASARHFPTPSRKLGASAHIIDFVSLYLRTKDALETIQNQAAERLASFRGFNSTS